MSVIHAPGKPRLHPRVFIFPALVLALFLALLVRLWYLQVAIAPELEEKAQLSGAIQESYPAPRGLIYDRNGKLIAGVEDQLVLAAKPSIVLQKQWELEKVAEMLRAAGEQNADAEKLLKKTRDGVFEPNSSLIIYAGLPVTVAGRIVENPANFPGLTVLTRPVRSYPDPFSFSQMLGYVWLPSETDIERAKAEGRDIADLVGKGGLEYQYESELMGNAGLESYQKDRSGRRTNQIEDRAPEPGKRLTLTLDAELQRAAVKALSGHRGAVVAIEPSSGEVLCLASRPTFDLNLFRNGIGQEDFDALNQNSEHPFINRATNSAFAPGSTFKIVTTVAAMRAGVFDPNRVVFCGGGYRLGKQFFKCLGHHGPIAFQQALEKSCNTYFSDLAMRVGKEELRKTALDMGFFAKTGLDLPSERSGLIPTDDWLARAKRNWVPGYTVLMGIGQGDVLTTPLQMANLAAMVANSGTTYRPHLVRTIGDSPSRSGEVLRQVDLPEAEWEVIRSAMRGVISHGTAAGSQIPGIEWAGKTGSAEVQGQAKTNSWFIGFAPAQNPKIAICVVVEAVGHGSDFAAPVARRVVETYLKPSSVLSNVSSQP